MKSQILLLAFIVAALSSCTTVYKTGQTPDDVYFSPTRPHDEYVQVEKQEDNNYRGEDYYEDRYIRMRVQNRYQWSVLDDYYFDNPYAYNYYGNYSKWNNPWNSYWTWNNYYNPYCHSGGGIIIKNPAAYQPPPSKPIVFNPSSYLGNTNNTQRSGVKSNSAYYNNSYNSAGARYNNNNLNSGSGSSNRNNYSNSNSNNNSYTPSSNSTPTRSYTPSSSSSSSNSSSSGSSNSGGGGTSRPKR
jgi:hypothetical protein